MSTIVKKVMSKLFVGILLASVLIGLLAVTPEKVRAENWSIQTVDSEGDVGPVLHVNSTRQQWLSAYKFAITGQPLYGGCQTITKQPTDTILTMSHLINFI